MFGFVSLCHPKALHKSESALHRDINGAKHFISENFRAAGAVKQMGATRAKAVTYPSCCSSQVLPVGINLCKQRQTAKTLLHWLCPVMQNHICSVERWDRRTSCQVTNAEGPAEGESAERNIWKENCGRKECERSNWTRKQGVKLTNSSRL